MRVRFESLRRSLAMACVPVVVFSAFALRPVPVMAQIGCRVPAVFDTPPSPLTGIINTYYPGRASVAAGTATILVGAPTGSATPMAAGNLALVIQMQDASINSTDTSSYGDGDPSATASGSSNLNSTGLYEYVRIISVSGTSPNFTFTVQGGNSTDGSLLNSYNAVAPGTVGQKSFQVIRVPQYANATVSAGLTAKTWSGPVVTTGTGGGGPTGGILAFDVSDTLNFNGQTISVNGLGFRGGAGRALADEGTSGGANTAYRTSISAGATDMVHGSKGEGIAGTPRWIWTGSAYLDNTSEGYENGSYARGAPGNAGGGGNDGQPSVNDQNSGGGGGGNAGAGGHGGFSWNSVLDVGGFGGAASGPSGTRLFLGGGGGAGTTNNGGQASTDAGLNYHDESNPTGQYSSGGPGGGMILIRTCTVTGTGTLTANGGNAPFDAGRDGGGGGGAGGTVAVAYNTNSGTINIQARGGDGGDAWPNVPGNGAGTDPDRHGPGAGGGGGFAATSGSSGVSVSLSGGVNGVTTTDNTAYGATAGSVGTSITTYTLTSVPGVSSSCECRNVSSVEMVSGEAQLFDTGAIVRWQTLRNDDNLGFYVYRDENGVRTRLTPGLVAGSALKTSARVSAGFSYTAWDPKASSGSTYWVEEIDLSGRRTLYGPFSPTRMVGPAPIARTSPTLGARRLEEAGSGIEIWSQSRGVAYGKGSSTPPPPKGGGAASALSTQWAIAAQPALKLAVREIGWYRVDATDIQSAGINLASIDPRTLRLYADGVEIPILVQGEADGRFDAGDAVEFYGTGVDLPSTDTRVYYLTTGQGQGQRMKIVPASQAQAAARTFPSTVEFKPRTTHFALLANGEKENFFGDPVAFEPLDQTIRLPRVDGLAGTAEFAVTLQGVTLVPHTVEVAVNGTPVGTLRFADLESGTGRFTVPQSLLIDGDNTVTLTPDVSISDVSLVDAIRVTYQRLPLADGARLLANAPGGRQPISFGGFSSSDLRVVNVTNPLAAEEILGTVGHAASGFAISVLQPAAPSRLIAFSASGASKPASITLNVPSALNRAGQAVDAVFVTTRAFAPSLQPLVTLRQQQGYRVAVVDIEDIFDEFGYGYSSPAAVREFVRRAKSAWSPGPRFIVLAGDGSFDPRNYFGLGGNLIPTKPVQTSSLETVSDDWMADLDNDGVPEVAVGRLPVNSLEELQAVVAKIVRYESEPVAPRSALSVADTSDTYDFTGASSRMLSVVPAPVSVTSINRQLLGDSAAREAVLEAFAGGQDLVVYSGHGGVTVWRGGLLTSDDAIALTTEGRLSVSVLANCLNGYFAAPGERSVGEALVMAPAGGSVVAWASSGLSDPGWQELMLTEFVREAFVPGRTTGDAARAAKAACRGDVRLTWVLIGDPMTVVH